MSNPTSYNRRARGWILGSLLLVACLVWACQPAAPATSAPRGSGGVNGLPVPTRSIPANTVAPPSLAPVPSDPGLRPGTYRVGADMQAGRWMSAGPEPDALFCNWSRNKDD